MLAALLLVTFRFAGVVNWPWWWVLCPLWLPLLIAVVAGTGALAMSLTGPTRLSEPSDSSSRRRQSSNK
jgi:hypothetical protein